VIQKEATHSPLPKGRVIKGEGSNCSLSESRTNGPSPTPRVRLSQFRWVVVDVASAKVVLQLTIWRSENAFVPPAVQSKVVRRCDKRKLDKVSPSPEKRATP
jgi:hypothetical protein